MKVLRVFRLETEVEPQLKGRGMTVVKDVDLAAFRKTGEKAYEVLKIIDAKNAVHKPTRCAGATN